MKTEKQREEAVKVALTSLLFYNLMTFVFVSIGAGTFDCMAWGEAFRFGFMISGCVSTGFVICLCLVQKLDNNI